jgi:hypothetical protein
MNKLSFYILALFAMFFACNDNDSANCIVISGGVITETRQVSDFHSISLEGIGNILLTQGTPQSLRIETHQSVLGRLTTSVSNNVLQIKLEDCIEGSLDKLDIHITIPDIEKLEILGVGNIIGQNELDLDALEIDIEGVGDISLYGSTDRLEITSSGVGNVRAFDLISGVCEVFLTGAGNVEVTAENELEANISGAGNIFYKGTPVIEANISGSGNLINAN